jgi:hypothetical protein
LQKLQGSVTCEEVERQWEKGRVCKRLSCIEVLEKLQGKEQRIDYIYAKVLSITNTEEINRWKERS